MKLEAENEYIEHKKALLNWMIRWNPFRRYRAIPQWIVESTIAGLRGFLSVRNKRSENRRISRPAIPKSFFRCRRC